jgi:hypothetical protein
LTTIENTKTFKFTGTVKSAKGLLKRMVINKPVTGVITVTGQNSDFDFPINKVFSIGGKLNEAPLIGSFFPGKDISGENYLYQLKSFKISEEITSDSGKAKISLVLFPWIKLDSVKLVFSSNSMFYKLMVNNVFVEGASDCC